MLTNEEKRIGIYGENRPNSSRDGNTGNASGQDSFLTRLWATLLKGVKAEKWLNDDRLLPGFSVQPQRRARWTTR